MQVRGTGPHSNCLPNDSDASVGERIPHVVASIPSGNSARNRLLCPQKGNVTVLDYLAFFESCISQMHPHMFVSS